MLRMFTFLLASTIPLGTEANQLYWFSELYEYPHTLDQMGEGSCVAEAISLAVAIRDTKYFTSKIPEGTRMTLPKSSEMISKIVTKMMDWRRARLWAERGAFPDDVWKNWIASIGGWHLGWNYVLERADPQENFKLTEIDLHQAETKLRNQEAVLLVSNNAKYKELYRSAKTQRCITCLPTGTRSQAAGKDDVQTHAMCIVPDSKLDADEIRVKNSWGCSWGYYQNGTFVMKKKLLDGRDSDFSLWSLEGAEKRIGFTTLEKAYLPADIPQMKAAFGVTTDDGLWGLMPEVYKDLYLHNPVESRLSRVPGVWVNYAPARGRKTHDKVPVGLRDVLQQREQMFKQREQEHANKRFQVHIRAVAGAVHTIDIDPNQTIGHLKSKIQALEGLTPEQQTLFSPPRFVGERLVLTGDPVLQDGRTLSDYNIEKDTTIYLCRNFDPPVLMPIVVLGSGLRIPLDVAPSATIQSIKARIQDKQGTPSEDQRLYYAGKYLENERTIAECSIQKDGTLSLVVPPPPPPPPVARGPMKCLNKCDNGLTGHQRVEFWGSEECDGLCSRCYNAKLGRAGWRERKDAQGYEGTKYYFNDKTGEAQWERPNVSISVL